MKVLISNVYSYKNKGDAAILISLINEINRVFNLPSILIQTTDIINDQGKYGYGVTPSLLWTLLSAHRNKNILYRLLYLIYGHSIIIVNVLTIKLFKQSFLFIAPKNLQAYVSTNLNSDFVIACGGGYLRSTSRKPSETLLLYITCLNIIFPKLIGKKVFLYSQSIGPVHGVIQTALLKVVLSNVDIIESRERITTKYLESLNINSIIHETADAVLLLINSNTPSVPLASIDDKRFNVGITVRKWFNNSESLENYIDQIAKTIDGLVDKYDAKIYYLPQVIASGFGDDDRIIAEAVYEKVNLKDSFNIISEDLSPDQLISIAGKMKLFIGTRMHSNIFALISSVPVIAIEYEHKTRGIMESLKIGNFTIDINTMTSDSILDKVVIIQNDREKYISNIKEGLKIQRRKSSNAIQLIKDAI